MKFKLSLLALLAVAVNLFAAGKIYWQENGVLISGIDGMGIGDFMADMRGGAYNITGDLDSVYVIRIDKNGNLPWGLLGKVVDNDNFGGMAFQMNPRGVTDGKGGAIIVWDKLFPTGHELYYQRMDSLGNTMWGSAQTVTLSDSSQENHVVVGDGANGAIVAWQQYRSGQYDIYAQRIDSNGVRQWGDNGVAGCTAAGTQQYPEIAKDDSGNVFICWWDTRSDAGDVFGQKLNQNGMPAWVNNGIAIADTLSYQAACGVVAADSGSWIISWGDGRSGNYDVYAQRIDRYGNELWSHQGELVCGAQDNQIVPKIISDGNGGAILCWWDARNDIKYDIYSQRIDKNGVVKWINNGVPICNADSAQEEVCLTNDGSGGTIICWQDNRAGKNETDIYAQHVDSSGNVKWETNGMAICTATAMQERPHIVQSDSGTVIIAWPDYRDNYARAYAQRVGDDPNGLEGTSNSELQIADYKLNQNYPNPFHQSTMINYQIPKTGMVSLKVYNITGQLVRTLVDTRMAMGLYSYNWDGKDDRKRDTGNGIYFYQLQVDGNITKTNKMIKLR